MLPCCKGNNNCEVKKVNEVKEAKEGQEDACVYPNNIRFASFRKHKKTNTDMRKPLVWLSYDFFETGSVNHSATDGRRSLVGINKSVFFVELAKGAV
jgi:hypothetical protein